MKLILLLFALFCLAACDDSSNDVSKEEIKQLLSSNGNKGLSMVVEALLNSQYKEDKLGTIQDAVNAFKQDKNTANVTLIGSQNVYNADGTLKEIRTIELSIPDTEDESSVIYLDLKDTDSSSGLDSDDLDQLRDTRDTFEALSLLGIDMDLVYSEQADPYEEPNVIVISKNFMMLKSMDGTFINETIKMDTAEAVKSHYTNSVSSLTGKNLDELQKEDLAPSILMYDTKGMFLKENSTVTPELMSSIAGISGEVPNDLLKASLHALTNAVLESDDSELKDVPEEVRKHLSKLYPDLYFIVMEEAPESTHMSDDFSINLRYDLLDLQDGLEYTVYGYNRTVTSK